jgi:hypothetical protein
MAGLNSIVTSSGVTAGNGATTMRASGASYTFTGTDCGRIVLPVAAVVSLTSSWLVCSGVTSRSYFGTQPGRPSPDPARDAGRTDRVGAEKLVRDMAQLVCTRASGCRACPIFAVAFHRDTRWTSSAARRQLTCGGERTPPRTRRRGLAEAEGSLIPETREGWTAALTTPARGQHRMTAWLYGSLV